MNMPWFSRRKLHSITFFFILAIVCCFFFTQWGDKENYISAVQTIGMTWFCLLLLLSLLNYGLRIIRWQNYLLMLGANLPYTLSTLSEASAFYLLLQRLGFNASLLFAFSAYALATLAGAISFMPGGLGSTEAVMAALLLMSGMPEAKAIVATVIIRITTLWFAVFLGTIALVLGKRVLVNSNIGPSSQLNNH